MTSRLRPDSYARQTLERYTGSSLEDFGAYILLCNFRRYVDAFSQQSGAAVQSANWHVVHDTKRSISLINFGVGSPSAGIVMHCLSYLDRVECVLMLGMCGGIDDSLEVGDLLIPTASVRDEGTSRHYLPQDVPAQPSFWINRVSEEVIARAQGRLPKSGIMITTDFRMWEFDREFIDYLLDHRILAVDMEIATLFAVGYALNVPVGAIMLISDLPLRKGGIKDKQHAAEIFEKYTGLHLDLGVQTLAEIARRNHISKKQRSKCQW